MMIKENDVLKAFSTMSRMPNNSHHLLNAYFVASTVLSIFQSLLNFTTTLYMIGILLFLIIDQETEVWRVTETCLRLQALFLKIILLAKNRNNNN